MKEKHVSTWGFTLLPGGKKINALNLHFYIIHSILSPGLLEISLYMAWPQLQQYKI